MTDPLLLRDTSTQAWCAELYTEHAGKLLSFFLKRRLSYQAAQDALNDTFVDLCIAIEKEPFGSKDALLRCMWVAAGNNAKLGRQKLIEDNRRLRRHREPDSAMVSESTPEGYYAKTQDPPEPNPFAALGSRALDTLSERQRELFVANEQEGMTYDQVASLYHISKGTVKKVLSVSRAKMHRFGVAAGVPMCVPKKPRGRSK